MSQINPFTGAIIQSTQVQQTKSTAQDKHIRRVQNLGKNAGLTGDQLEHQVESTDAAIAGGEICPVCLEVAGKTAKAFLDRNPKATDGQIRQALSTVLCRCGAHTRMMRAIHRYAEGTRS